MSLLGDNDAQDTLINQLKQFDAISAPSAESMQVKLQKLVAAGVLTPEQAQAALVNGNGFDGLTGQNEGMSAEEQALGSLGNMAEQGGSDATEKADLQNILNQVGAQTKGANDAVLQSQAARGALTGGETLAAQLLNNSSGAQTANSAALTANAAAQQRQMEALNSLGTLGGNVQGQIYSAGANKANAANAINQFNAQQQQATNQFNTLNKNQAQQMNLANNQDLSNQNTNNANNNSLRDADLIQRNFDNQLNKATGYAQASQALAKGQQDAANSKNAFIGNSLGTGGTLITGLSKAYGAGSKTSDQGGAGNPSSMNSAFNYSGDGMQYAWNGGEIKDFKSGGEVPGHAKVPGDSPANDTVPARLSPGEIVVPRSVAQTHDPASVHNFLNRVTADKHPMTKPSIHPKDVASVLSALTHLREGGTH